MKATSPPPENRPAPSENHSPRLIVRILDRPVVAAIKVLILLARLKSRDPNEHPTRLLRPDPHETTRIRNWEAVLAWSPEKRVGCAAGVLVGLLLGGAFLWYNLN